jgi:hypothetical protein
MKNLSKILPFVFLFPTAAYAADPPTLDGAIGPLVDTVLSYLFPIAGIICIIYVVIGGYMWMISAGDPARVKKAQGTLTWALLGLAFVLVAVGIIQVITKFIGA